MYSVNALVVGSVLTWGATPRPSGLGVQVGGTAEGPRTRLAIQFGILYCGSLHGNLSRSHPQHIPCISCFALPCLAAPAGLWGRPQDASPLPANPKLHLHGRRDE
jgi:hypothetical protein